MFASRTFERANTIPEMALVLSLVMLTLFGIVQYALVGFNQIGSDGAAFVGDHSAVAYYGNPTNSNSTYAQQVGQTAFPHANASFSGQVPTNRTYEMDVTQTHQSIGFAQLFPQTTQTYSRIIEPSQSQTAIGGPLGPCGTAVESDLYNNTPVVTSSPVPLLGNTPGTIFSTIQTSTGTALQLNLGVVGGPTSETGILASIGTNFDSTVSALATIQQNLSALTTVTGGTNALSLISQQLAPLLNSATGGVYTSSSGGGASVSLSPPMTGVQFSTQVGVTTNAIAAIEAANPTLPFRTLNLYLFGNPNLPVSGVFPSGGLLGANSPLTALNTAQNALYSLDNTVVPCPSVQ